ncbi:MAG: CHASE3 domain-containing protein [Betaproteobacteria bacterium]
MKRRLLDSLYDKMLSRLGLALLAMALLINLGALLAVDAGVRKLDEARARAVHSRDVTAEIQSIQSLLYEAESAQRGFLYTTNEDYLKPLNENEGQISARLAKLRAMVADDPAQQARVDRMGAIVRERLAEMNKTVAVQHMGRKEDTRDIVLSDLGRTLTEEFDKIVARFLLSEDQVLQERMQRWTDIQLAIRWGFAAIFFINALLLLAGAMTIMRDIARKREELVRLDELAMGLASEVVQRAAELRALSAHLLRVQEEERRTLARELHDELGGTLSAIKLDILMGRDAAAKRNDEKSVARLQRALAAIDSAIQFIRRLIEDLRPTLLDNLGLEAALRAMTEQFSERAGCRCMISLPEGKLNLTSAQSTALYRICQEALTNAMKYAKAKQVTISLSCDASQWLLVLADDGVGLDATKQHRSMSHGLLGMRERTLALGGTFDIRGKAGQGTILTATFPVVESEPLDS